MIKTNNYLENIDMDVLSRLAEQKTELTYTKLCTLVGLEIVKGNSKECQLKQLAQCCNFEREGKIFKINEVFDSFIARSDSKSKYIQYVELIILGSMQKGEQRVFTTSQLLESFALCNANYKLLSSPINKAKIAMETSYSKSELTTFQRRSRKILGRVIRDCLKQLERRELISVDKGYQYCKLSVNLHDDFGKIKYKYNAFESEPLYEELLKIEEDVKREMQDTNELHIGKFGYVANENERRKYWQECNERAKELLKTEFFYKVKRITSKRCRINCHVHEAKEKLNTIICAKLQEELSDKAIDLIDAFIKKPAKHNFFALCNEFDTQNDDIILEDALSYSL